MVTNMHQNVWHEVKIFFEAAFILLNALKKDRRKMENPSHKPFQDII